MNDFVLDHFRSVAKSMNAKPAKTGTWYWIGKTISQTKWDISEEEARRLARERGGIAKNMEG